MELHNLIQGTPAWLAYRQSHFNASDAAAMLGMSPFKTRSQLMHEMHTGIVPEVDPRTQARFDAGHAAEAAARPLAEEMIDDDLFPVVGSLTVDGSPLSASFDGLTMARDIVFEHKLMNVALAESLASGIIPDQYAPQLEQQLLVSGAEKALFMATSMDKTAMECVWYTSIPGIRSQIIDGWKQFAADLETYVPEVVEAAPVGRTPETLPALHIEVTGMVTASNLSEYKAHALAVFASVNRELKTDQDFADAKKAIKWAGDIETRLQAAKEHGVRLELNNLVKTRDTALKAEIVADGRNALAGHIHACNQRIGRPLMPAIPADFAAVIKGMSKFQNMRDAVATELARAKISANEWADKISLNLKAINEQEQFAFLFADVAQLALKDSEFVAMAIKNRVADHHAAEAAMLAAETARITEQERIKAERIAQARADAEIAAATAAAQAEASRVSAEAIAKAQAEPQVVEVRLIEKSMFVHEDNPPIAHVSIAHSAIDIEAQTTPPILNLGVICSRLGFQVTADFLRSLGFEPAGRERAAVLFHEADFARICNALVRHINAVRQGVTA